MRIRRGWMLAALVAAPALAQAQSCPSLSSIELPGGSWRIEQPLVAAASAALKPHGWQVQVREAPEGFVGPTVSGQVSASTLLQALQDATQAARASGWKIDALADRSRCTLTFVFDGQQATIKTDSSAQQASSSAAASASSAAAPAAVAAPRWTIAKDEPLHQALQRWAQEAGWTFAWKPKRTWLAPAPAEFGGTFEQAASTVVEALFDQGKPLRLVLWVGNRYAEVLEADGL